MKRVSSTASELNDFVEDESGAKLYNVSKSRLVGLINWVHVATVYWPLAWFVIITLLAVQICHSLMSVHGDLTAFYLNQTEIFKLPREFVMTVGWKAVLLLVLAVWYLHYTSSPVYLMDFSTFEPPEDWKVSPEKLIEIMKAQTDHDGKLCFTEESIDFMTKMLAHSGCGPSTAWPPGIVKCLTGAKADRSAEAARKESEVVIFTCVEELLKKTKTNPKSIDFLVINCSLFSPTPSLCSMVINQFGLKSEISSYNLSGMGCSAGLISIELVKNLLAAKPNSTALVISTENLTQNLYHGNERSFLLQNTLFRCGGAAVLLTNRWLDGYRAQFKLLHSIRTQYVNEDSFGCVYETEDIQNQRGVRLSKDIVKVAGRAMEKNFTRLGPYVLPISEQFKTVYSIAMRFLADKLQKAGYEVVKPRPYVPDFKRGIDHFCIHAGGRGVIDGIQKNLQLSPTHVEASRYALMKYGNTSSSSIWYECDYIRKEMSLRRGQRLLQVAFGSGFKCNTAVWLCLNVPSFKKDRAVSARDEREAGASKKSQ